MSLDPHWYSTYYGIYVFAGAATVPSVLALLALALEKKGRLLGILTVEHRHDIGKLLFGFIVFWAYIAFSQFILIRTPTSPRRRSSTSTAGKDPVHRQPAPALRALHRAVHRAPGAQGQAEPADAGVVAVLMLAMHYVDMYWLVMPNLDHHGAHPSWIDLAGLLGPAGAGALTLALRARQSPLYPFRDPRLAIRN